MRSTSAHETNTAASSQADQPYPAPSPRYSTPVAWREQVQGHCTAAYPGASPTRQGHRNTRELSRPLGQRQRTHVSPSRPQWRGGGRRYEAEEEGAGAAENGRLGRFPGGVVMGKGGGKRHSLKGSGFALQSLGVGFWRSVS